jgi:hypothetical protein
METTETRLATAPPPGAADHPQPATAWRFSLGSLFRAIAVAAVALWAVRLFGPLAAVRDVGIALAIVLAITALYTRSRRWWLGAGLALTLGLIPSVLAGGAPFSWQHSLCVICGQSRDTYQVCGRTVSDNVKSTDISRWAEPLVPAGHVHQWAGCYMTSRDSWFGGTLIGCGRVNEGAPRIWHLARRGDPAAAERLLREYLDIAAGRSPKSLTVHNLEVELAIVEAAK